MCAESEDEQQLLVRSDSGTLRLVPARPTDTVDRLQSEIQRLGLDPGPLRFFGRHLEGSRTLASYGIGPLSELELCSAGLLGGGQGLFTYQASSASECGVESGSDSSASGSDVESDSAEEDDAENEDAAPSVGEAQDPPGMDSPTSIASQPLEGFADPDHQVRLYEDWEELQQIEFLLRYITGDEAARGHIPRRLGRPIVAGPGSDGSRLSSLFSMGPFPDMAITAMLTDHAAFDGFVFTDGPTVRFVPVPMRLRLEPLAPFDVDALGYEELLQLAEELGSVPHRRATPEMLRRLPLFKWSAQLGNSNQSCVICQEAYEAGEEVRKLPCAHVFHRECIDRWLTTGGPISLQCPICKAQALE